jgi:hypothetical protein
MDFKVPRGRRLQAHRLPFSFKKHESKPSFRLRTSRGESPPKRVRGEPSPRKATSRLESLYIFWPATRSDKKKGRTPRAHPFFYAVN